MPVSLFRERTAQNLYTTRFRSVKLSFISSLHDSAILILDSASVVIHSLDDISHPSVIFILYFILVLLDLFVFEGERR